MNCEVDPARYKSFMDFLGKQALATNFRQTLAEVPITFSADLMFLERSHVTQDRAKTGQTCQKRPRLPQRQR